VFLTNWGNPLYFAVRIAGLQGLPWVFTAHPYDPLFWDVAKAIHVKSRHGKIVAVSRYVGQAAIKYGLGIHPRVNPDGVSALPPAAHFSVASFTVVCSGRMVEQQQRLSLILQAMAFACRHGPSYRVLVDW
jgi:hypothetical protein